MGDEGSVMKLLLEMMSCWEEKPRGELQACDEAMLVDLGGDTAATPAAEPPPPAPSADHQTEVVEEEEEEYVPEPPPRRYSMLLNSRYRHREQRKKVLRLANEKLNQLEDNERQLRQEKDLRRQILLQNMASRLEQEARQEKAARQASRARSYSRTLGRSFGGQPRQPQPPEQQRKRRRCDSDCDLLGADVHEMFSDLCGPPAPLLIAPLDQEDEALTKRPRLFCTSPQAEPGCCDPSVAAEAGRCGSPAAQEQVRFGGEAPLIGCGAAAGFTDFQHMFHQLVPSLES